MRRRAGSAAPFFASSRALFDRGDALGAKRGENVFLRRKIIEERSLADVGGFGDVFNGGFQIAALGEEAEGGAKQALANFGAVALAAPGDAFYLVPRSWSGSHSHSPGMTSDQT